MAYKELLRPSAASLVILRESDTTTSIALSRYALISSHKSIIRPRTAENHFGVPNWRTPTQARYTRNKRVWQVSVSFVSFLTWTTAW